MPVAIRINGARTEWHGSTSSRSCIRSPTDRRAAGRGQGRAGLRPQQTGKPVLAMIETAKGVLAAPEIAHEAAALIAGTNDLAADLRLPPGRAREPLQMALQSIVLAARAAGIAVFDGVFNGSTMRKASPPKRRRAALGFDGKSLIHPDQIAPCHAPSRRRRRRNRARRAAGRRRDRRRRALRRRDDRAHARRGGAARCWRGPNGARRGLANRPSCWHGRAWPTSPRRHPARTDVRRRAAAAARIERAAEPGRHQHLPDPRNPAQHPDPVVGDGHGDRGRHGDRAGPARRDRRAPPQPWTSRSRPPRCARSSASKAGWWSIRSP
jgi:hypothetical protein